MDSDLKTSEDLLIDKELEILIKNEAIEDVGESLMDSDVIIDSTEDHNENQSTEEVIVDTTDSMVIPSTEETNLNPIETEVKVQQKIDVISGNEEFLANDVKNLDVNEDVVEITNTYNSEESEEVFESKNSRINDSERMSTDVDMSSDKPVIRDEATNGSPTVDFNTIDESNEPSILPSVDEDISDSDLRIAGLKTSLMLSEGKNKELEEELKKVYQHLFKSLDEKKNLQKKCETLEEQLDKLMATSAQKRPAKESPGNTAKPTPPKKTLNHKSNAEMYSHSNDQKSVRFKEQRPSFGRFGARFQRHNNDMTPPPFPGRYAPAFQPPMAMPSTPMSPYRGAPVMASPEMADMALTDAFQLISNIGNRLQLTATIVDRAIRLFRLCYESPLRAMCRTQNQSTATACVYIACREEHCPQTFKTLCSVAKVDQKVMSDCCKHIVSQFGLCLDQMTTDEAIVEFCANSGLSLTVQRAADQIARKALQMNLVSKNPLTAAAAAILMATMASDEQRPVFEIALLTGVGDTTIRNTYNRMLSYARQLFPSNFPFFTPPEQLPRV